MFPGQLWRTLRVAGLMAAIAGTSLAQTESDDVAQLKAQVAQLQKQIELLSKKLEQIGEKSADKPVAAAQAAPAVGDQTAVSGKPRTYPPQSLTASTAPVPTVPAAAPPSTAVPALPPMPRVPPPQGTPESPLQLHLGNITITPVGFMDLTGSWKSENAGGSLGTNFGNFPYNSVFPQSQNPEWRFSPQNSRLGFRVDGQWKGWRFIGYNEFDFLGTNASNNISVTNGAFMPRLRLFWVDTRKGAFEFLAGQSWSMLTPNRKGISALPGDIFYSQVIDVNYIVGLPWDRQPGVRFLYHPSEKVTMGVSLENPDQYIGGSGGGGTITLPSLYSGFAGSQLDNASNVQTIPNVHPDIIAKVAFDPGSRVHFEVAGLERTFRVYDTAGPNIGNHTTTAGGGGSVNGNFEVAKGFRLVSNNFWSDGGGRYLFGLAPDLIIRPDGKISPIHSGGFNEGFEATVGKFLLYGYYGAVYAGRNTALDTSGSLVGYGYRGAANSQNKTMQEITFGYNHTLWKSPAYGAINLMAQYAYFLRNPWYIAPNTPKNAHFNTIFMDVRYTLPGSAPTVVPK